MVSETGLAERLRRELDAAQSREARLREALAFYADPDTWRYRHVIYQLEQPEVVCRSSWRPIMADRGNRARTALASVEDSTTTRGGAVGSSSGS